MDWGHVHELGGVLLCRKRKKRATMQQGWLSNWLVKHDTLQIKAGDWDSIAVILYVYGYNYLRSQCAYDSLPKRIILESRLFSGDNKFMFTYTTHFPDFIQVKEYFDVLFLDETKYLDLEYNILINSYYTKRASFLFSNLENHIFCLEIYLLTLEIYLLTLD
ncbi:hypothetical protein ACJX0J_001769 [Zea mays]